MMRRTLSITWGAAWQGHIRAFLLKSKTVIQPSQPDSTEGRGLSVARTLEDTATRVAYLEYLKAQGLNGLHEFLYAFLASLADKKKRSAQPAASSSSSQPAASSQ